MTGGADTGVSPGDRSGDSGTPGTVPVGQNPGGEFVGPGGDPLDFDDTLPGPPATYALNQPVPEEDLPGEPAEFGPGAGALLLTAGVPHENVLDIRDVPGGEIIATVDTSNPYPDLLVVRHAPSGALIVSLDTWDFGILATGRNRRLPESNTAWFEVRVGGITGWSPGAYLAPLGLAYDATAEVLELLGEPPVAATLTELGLLVAEAAAPAGPPTPRAPSTQPPSPDDPRKTEAAASDGSPTTEPNTTAASGQSLTTAAASDESPVTAAASDGSPARMVVTVQPTLHQVLGAVAGEIGIDALGVGDDSILGYRFHVFGTPANADLAVEDAGPFTFHSVIRAVLCYPHRSVISGGFCG